MSSKFSFPTIVFYHARQEYEHDRPKKNGYETDSGALEKNKRSAIRLTENLVDNQSE
jgi:hypothetical protein